jgi:hypothetical protein
MDDIFLGELPQDTSAGTPPAGYDGSGVNPNLDVKEVIIEEEEETVSSNNWIMYLGVGIMAYVLLFKKK